MTLAEIVQSLLLRLDLELPQVAVVTVQEVADWPTGAFDTLLEERLLVPVQPARSVTCDGCHEDHVEEVEFISEPPGTPQRAYIFCPTVGRVAVEPDLLRQWSVDARGIASAIARFLVQREPRSEPVLSRVWEIGPTDLHPALCDVVVARGLCWSDGRSRRAVEDAAEETPRLLVLTMCGVPAGLPGGVAVLRVGDVLTVDHGGVALRRGLLVAAARSISISAEVHPYRFGSRGDYWTIVYDGRESLIRDSVGLRYIAYLLQRPGEEVGALQLTKSVRGVTLPAAISSGEAADAGLRPAGSDGLDPLLDDEAKRSYRQRLAEIDGEFAEAEGRNDLDAAADLAGERDFIRREMGKAIGIVGRDRPTKSDTERARTAVSNAIRSAIKHLEWYDRDAARFLSGSIKTGLICRYEPPAPIPWEF